MRQKRFINETKTKLVIADSNWLMGKPGSQIKLYGNKTAVEVLINLTSGASVGVGLIPESLIAGKGVIVAVITKIGTQCKKSKRKKSERQKATKTKITVIIGPMSEVGASRWLKGAGQNDKENYGRGASDLKEVTERSRKTKTRKQRLRS